MRPGAPCENRARAARSNLEAEATAFAAAAGIVELRQLRKGDASRCASCPHLGKPAFKENTEGSKLVLDLTDDLGYLSPLFPPSAIVRVSAWEW